MEAKNAWALWTCWTGRHVAWCHCVCKESSYQHWSNRNYRKVCSSELGYCFRQVRDHKILRIFQGKVLPAVLQLELQTHPRVWLWKKLNCNQTSQYEVEVKKVNFFFLDFWLQKGTSCANPLCTWTPRSALGFNSLLSKGAPKFSCRSQQGFAGKNDHLCLSRMKVFPKWPSRKWGSISLTTTLS